MATTNTMQVSQRRRERAFIGALRPTLRAAALALMLPLVACAGNAVPYNGPPESAVFVKVNETGVVGDTPVTLRHDYLLSAKVITGPLSGKKECWVEIQDLDAPVSLGSIMRGVGEMYVSAQAARAFRSHREEIDAMVGRDCGNSLPRVGIVEAILRE